MGAEIRFLHNTKIYTEDTFKFFSIREQITSHLDTNKDQVLKTIRKACKAQFNFYRNKRYQGHYATGELETLATERDCDSRKWRLMMTTFKICSEKLK